MWRHETKRSKTQIPAIYIHTTHICVMQVDDTNRDSVYVTVDEPDNNVHDLFWTKKKRWLDKVQFGHLSSRSSFSCCAYSVEFEFKASLKYCRFRCKLTSLFQWEELCRKRKVHIFFSSSKQIYSIFYAKFIVTFSICILE